MDLPGIKIKYFILISLFVLNGCSPVKKLKRLSENPVEYVFNVNSAELRKVIIANFSRLQYRHMELYQHGFDEDLVEYEPLKKPENALDFLLVPSNGDPIDYSYVYTKGLKGLPYIATFHLHLVEQDSLHTKVVINTLDPQVVVGKAFFPTFPHWGIGSRRKSVERSTIEEYEILKKIGDGLNQKMPEVKYPYRWSDF